MIYDLVYAVYSGSEKLDLGPKRITALCSSQKQAEVLIAGMWPGYGYWELRSRHDEQSIAR